MAGLVRKYTGIGKDDPLSPACAQVHDDMISAPTADKVPAQKALYNALCKGNGLSYSRREIDALELTKTFLVAWKTNHAQNFIG